MVQMLFVLVAALLIPASVRAQTTTQSPSEPVVVVSGEGLVKAAPDQAWVTLATESRSKGPKDAQAQNATAMNTVQERLTAAGIPKNAIRTVSYDLQMESDWVNGRRVPRGYVARNTIEIRLDDIKRVGEVIDLSVTGGVTAVHGVRFDLKDRESQEREALKRATADARARAEAAASGAGMSIGRVIRIEEPTSRPYPIAAQPPMMMREAAQANVPTPIVATDVEIRVNVVLTATLK